MDKKGFTLLETIISITIFVIFMGAMAMSFSMYINVSGKNDMTTYERINDVSKLEIFLAEDIKKGADEITLVKKNGLKNFPKEIICIQKKEKNSENDEVLKAFIFKEEVKLKEDEDKIKPKGSKYEKNIE